MLFQTRHWSHALGRVWKGKICLENANKTPAPPSQNLSQHLLSYSSSSPSNKAQDPFPGKLPSNWLQLKATFWISESRRAQERVWICVCVCRSGASSRWHFGYSRQGFLPRHLRLIIVSCRCAASLRLQRNVHRPKALSLHLYVNVFWHPTNPSRRWQSFRPTQFHKALSHTFSHSSIHANSHETVQDEFSKI